ncbi:FHA domain-containing protein [Ornithinimicrobium sp. Y1847]|uniref:FHA domain-containing protein n=1 Tax=Ornithinimicrobium sp. Y1847 TaxID=3405419 RepID=UPI003B68334C
MSPHRNPEKGGRTEPARPIGPESHPEETAVECPNCHATTVGEPPFCGACGYDFTTGVAPETPDPDQAPVPRPTSMQAAEPHEAYIDPRRDADEIELPTRPEDLALPAEDLPHRPTVPPPTPPSAAEEFVAHERAETLPPSREESAEWVAEVWVDHAWAATRESDQPVPDAGLSEVIALTSDNVVIGRTNVARGLHPDLDAGTDMGVSVRHAQLTSDGQRWWVEDLDTSNGTYVSTVGLDLPVEPIESGLRVLIDEDDRVYLGGWTRIMLRRRD